VAGLLALTLAVGCTDFTETSREPVDLAEDARLIGPETIEVGVMSCHGEPEITRLTQGDERVEVEVTATISTPGDACQDRLTVVLDAPLGDRDVVDLTSQRTLRVANVAR
jgi:hypothetical protein